MKKASEILAARARLDFTTHLVFGEVPENVDKLLSNPEPSVTSAVENISHLFDSDYGLTQVSLTHIPLALVGGVQSALHREGFSVKLFGAFNSNGATLEIRLTPKDSEGPSQRTAPVATFTERLARLEHINTELSKLADRVKELEAFKKSRDFF